MKKILLCLFLFSFLLQACDLSKDQPVTNSPATPDAFEDKSSNGAVLISKSRYNDDMVEKLFEELLEKNPVLKELDKAIAALDGKRLDSMKLFTKFDEKNMTYYGSASNHIERINDTALKLKMKSLIDNSKQVYNKDVAAHKNLIDLLNSKDNAISDLYLAVKIVKTLALTEKYQNENIPSTKSMEKMLGIYNKLIRQADTLLKADIK